MDWSDALILQLRELWDEGHSTAEIGRRLRVTKNAVVGKAGRLDLPARPSPIIRHGETRAPRNPPAVRRPKDTLPPLASGAVVPVPVAAPRQFTNAQNASLGRRPPAPVATPTPPPPAKPYGRVITCCWPIGEPGTRSFRFCDVASVPAGPYCAEHRALAYVKLPRAREEAARLPTDMGQPWGHTFAKRGAA